VAISADGAAWFLLNVSPEIRAQIESFPPLTPREPRHSPIAGLVLTNGDLDHCLGLLSLRESHPLTVYATESVRVGFTEGNVLYRTLERFDGQVTWRALAIGREQPLGDAGLAITAIATPGNLPLHLKSLRPPSAEDNVGLVVRDQRTGKRLAYFSGVAGPSPALERALAEADVLFFDGTFWSSDELIALGLGTRRAEEMSHWPLGGPEGSAAFLARQPGRRILIHVNNTNPILREGSAERRALEAAGIEVAADGLELAL
jgi:pyrroloquinoline quinone biosynthesis protein B